MANHNTCRPSKVLMEFELENFIRTTSTIEYANILNKDFKLTTDKGRKMLKYIKITRRIQE
jgi:hypothetical protein